MKNEAKMYEKGSYVWHSSDGDGPDVGVSLGIGNGRMIYVGEIPGAGGCALKIYGQSDAETYTISDNINREEGDRFIDLLQSLI